ncbi:hypothetical protein C0993_007785 [Termitomyces sp. T159_Od127]|nr:hypothetical protein C0993_007785 [Termitomyces sp. T159_Od127]
MSHVRSSLDSGQPSLRPVYDLIASKLRAIEEHLFIIFDDIASLQWVGFPILDISRFARSLRALSHQTRSTLVIRHHNVTPEEPDDLFRHLLHLCTYHLEVLPLSSGKSGSVSGELDPKKFQIALHPGMSTSAAGIKLIPRSSAVQYRLTDTGANYFDRGTGGGIL